MQELLRELLEKFLKQYFEEYLALLGKPLQELNEECLENFREVEIFKNP